MSIQVSETLKQEHGGETLRRTSAINPCPQAHAHTQIRNTQKLNFGWLGMVAHTYNPNTHEVEAGEPEVQGHLQLQSLLHETLS